MQGIIAFRNRVGDISIDDYKILQEKMVQISSKLVD